MNLPSDPDPQSQSKDSISKVSELNNLLQIISGTSSLMENVWEGSEESEKYLSMLRSSIERAEKVAAEMVEQAGGAKQKMAMHPDLAGHINKPKAPAAPSGTKYSILIVDDEQMALTLVKRILSDAGFEVATAQSGFECINQVRQRPFGYDLILLDLTMPFMNGEETFNRVRELRADMPVVLCTGFIQQEKLKRLMSAGLSGFLRKPIAPDEIVGFVRSTLASLKYSRGAIDPNSIPAVI